MCDNTSALAWRSKQSTTTSNAAAYLLQVAAIHQRHHRYTAEHHYIPGPANVMADTASRSFHLSDTDLVSLFNSKFPQPKSWKLHHLSPGMNSALISSLRSKRLAPELYLSAQKQPSEPGISGFRFALPSTCTHNFGMWPVPFNSCMYLRTDGVTDASLPAASLTELAQWRMPSATSARRLPHWGPRTLV